MEPDGPLPYSQEPATRPYPEPVYTFPPYFHVTHFNIIFPSTPRSSDWLLPFRF
jgi:hypothetical protein